MLIADFIYCVLFGILFLLLSYLFCQLDACFREVACMLMLISNGFLLFFGNIAVVALVFLRVGNHIFNFAHSIVLVAYRISVAAVLLLNVKGFLSGRGVFHIKIAVRITPDVPTEVFFL